MSCDSLHRQVEEPPAEKYGAGDYWNHRYGNWAVDPYDWLFEWKDVGHIIQQFVKVTDQVLLPGCGNAPFSPDMYDAGFTNQVTLDPQTLQPPDRVSTPRQLNFDTSDVVIEQCKERNASRPGMQVLLQPR